MRPELSGQERQFNYENRSHHILELKVGLFGVDEVGSKFRDFQLEKDYEYVVSSSCKIIAQQKYSSQST